MEREPLSEKRTQEIYKLIYQLRDSNNVKIGCNESLKAINKNMALLVVVAKDAVPECIVEPLPVLCEQKGVDCVYVESKTALGKACKLDVDTVACTIFSRRDEDSSKIIDQITFALK